MFELCYHQHGGSGLNFTYADVMELSIDDFEWYYQKLEEQRSSEARRIKSASGKK